MSSALGLENSLHVHLGSCHWLPLGLHVCQCRQVAEAEVSAGFKSCLPAAGRRGRDGAEWRACVQEPRDKNLAAGFGEGRGAKARQGVPGLSDLDCTGLCPLRTKAHRSKMGTEDLSPNGKVVTKQPTHLVSVGV